jgi:hypothetical protein
MMSMARPRTTRRTPQPYSGTAQIRAHLITAQAAACADCGAHTAILAADIALLLAEVTRLRQRLTQARRRAANYQAAIYAAIGAQEDGEHDPIGYLRDELTGNGGGDALDRP